MTNDESFVLGYVLGEHNCNKTIIHNSGSNIEEWSPPDDWIPVPEPNTGEVYGLIDVVKPVYYILKFTGITSCSVDWGDGTTESGVVSDTIHYYPASGEQYLIHIWANGATMVSLEAITAAEKGLLILKYGDNVGAYSTQFTSNYWSLYEVRFSDTEIKAHQCEGYNCLKKVVLPNCTIIDEYAFAFCRTLSTIEMPNCIDIGANAFFGCQSLCTIDLSNCTSIAEQAFRGCHQLLKVELLHCRNISYATFENCYALQSILMPMCTNIADFAFFNCHSLQKIETYHCTSVGQNACRFCTSLKEVILPRCTTLKDSAFDCCYSLQHLMVSQNCTYDDWCLNNCYMLYPKPNE